MHHNRRLLSLLMLVAFVTGGAATPAVAGYHPALGRFMQADPNGQALLIAPELRYHAMNPTVTITKAYTLPYGDGMTFYEHMQSGFGIEPGSGGQLQAMGAFNPMIQYADGMSLYQYVRSNPVNYLDPAGTQAIFAPMWGVWGKYFPDPLQIAAMGGYTLGVMWANARGGWGPPTFAGRAQLIWKKFGWTNPWSFVAGFGWWGAKSFVPATAELMVNYGKLNALPKWMQTSVTRVASWSKQARSFPGSGLALPLVAATSAYVGILDAVMWTIDDEWP
jgi:hypothetical protein